MIVVTLFVLENSLLFLFLCLPLLRRVLPAAFFSFWGRAARYSNNIEANRRFDGRLILRFEAGKYCHVSLTPL
jgi:hypothetical protein